MRNLPTFTRACKVGPKLLTAKGQSPKTPRANFDVSANQLGTSTWQGSDGGGIDVWYEKGRENCRVLAADILANRIDGIMTFCDRVFAVHGKSGNVFIERGESGAYHAGCNFNADGDAGSDWYEDDFGLASAPLATEPGGLTAGLVMAEVCESYMGLANKGWDCGGSGGEGLSRVLGEAVSGGISGALSGGFSARSSYSGRDWISRDQGTDQDYDSTGCAMLYIDWMRKQGFTIDQIVQAGESDGTLAGNWSALTGGHPRDAFPAFTAAVGAVDISATNPFGVEDIPYPGTVTPPGPPTPPPTPPPAPLTFSFTADLPSVPCTVHGGFGRLLHGSTAGGSFTGRGTLDAIPGLDARAGGALAAFLKLLLQYGLPIALALLPLILTHGWGVLANPAIDAWIVAAVVAERNGQPLPALPPV